jgi:hypothetical protein
VNETAREPENGKSHRPRRSARNEPAIAADNGEKGDKKVDVFTAFLDALHSQP